MSLYMNLSRSVAKNASQKCSCNLGNLSQKNNFLWSRMVVTSAATKGEMNVPAVEDYWTKNKRLRRPVSPHLTIYKPQLTSMISISHRGSGVLLSTVLTGFSLGMWMSSEPFPVLWSTLESTHYGVALIFLAKFAISYPFVFHTLNGVRHLVWDAGVGFTLKTLYKSGYAVLGISALIAACLSSL